MQHVIVSRGEETFNVMRANLIKGHLQYNLETYYNNNLLVVFDCIISNYERRI